MDDGTNGRDMAADSSVSSVPNDLGITIRVSKMPGRWGSYVASARHPSELNAVAYGHGRNSKKALRNLEYPLGKWLTQRAIASWDGHVADRAADSERRIREHREKYARSLHGL